MDATTKPDPVPESYGPIQAVRRLGLAGWQFTAAQRRGLIGPPGSDGRWTGAEIDAAAAKVAEIVAVVGDQAPIGANRSAERMSQRLGFDIAADEVDALAERGLLAEAGEYKGWPLYDVHDLDQAADEHTDLIRELAGERVAWMTASLHPAEAARELGWSADELGRVAKQRSLTTGRFGRYARADVEALATDEDLAEQLRGDRLLGPDQAAVHLEIRRTDFDYCVAAGWIAPARYADSKIGRAHIEIPLYRVRDVEDLRDVPGVDWEDVRATPAGKPSPLRKLAKLPAERATLVREFADELGNEFGVKVAASYNYRADTWTLSWQPNAAGEPTTAVAHAALIADAALGRHARTIRLRLDDAPEAEEHDA
ncbi:hypothetical protein ACQHIV_42280 (plasmid) [Kribbella sp. GL6]|uniref:hypothetical protein n=1 Tax=Kribbella sp. GL6 TaxID=3419765 RepID=UPI003D035BB2